MKKYSKNWHVALWKTIEFFDGLEMNLIVQKIPHGQFYLSFQAFNDIQILVS